MGLEISGRNYDVNQRTRALIETKLAKIRKFLSDIIETRCVLEVQKYRNICEIIIVGKDFDVKAVQEAATMEDAILATVDHLKRQAQKSRKKVTDHHRRTRVPAEVDPSVGAQKVAASQTNTNATRGRRKTTARPAGRRRA